MKRTNILKSLGAKVVLSVVALCAVFTSCTKEEFNVEYKANNAKIFFNPVVIDAATKSIITNAELSFITDAGLVGNDTISGTEKTKGKIERGSVTITATINDVSGSAKVEYPEVPAGHIVTISPVILLSSKFDMKLISEETCGTEVIVGQGAQGHTHNGLNWNYNASDYFAKFEPVWDLKRQNKVDDAKVEILVSSKELQDAIKALNVEVEVKGKVAEPYMISAWAMYRADLTITSKHVTYLLTSKANGEIVAKIVVCETIKEATCKLIEDAIPGHAGHYHAGHGHGEQTNAGGGIVWGE